MPVRRTNHDRSTLTPASRDARTAGEVDGYGPGHRERHSLDLAGAISDVESWVSILGNRSSRVEPLMSAISYVLKSPATFLELELHGFGFHPFSPGCAAVRRFSHTQVQLRRDGAGVFEND